MLRKSVSLCGVLVVAGAAVILSAAKKDAPAELNLTDLDGKKVHLKDFRSKIVVVNFWATWCGPCKEEMPMFVDIEKAWATKGVVFIGASLDDKKSVKDVPAFLQKYKVDFPVWTGATSDDMDRLKMGEAVPDTAFIDETGTIVSRVEGEIKKNELVERLEWLTGDRKGLAPQALVRNLPGK